MTVTDWISALATVVVALGVVFAWRQLRLSTTALKADHERSRKESAISVLLEWQRNVNPQGSAANRLVSTWDDQTCRDLVGILTIKIKPDQRALVETCLGEKSKVPATQSDGFIHLGTPEVQMIKFHAVSHLNSIEIALCAWQLNIADRGTIANQFGFLYRPEEGYKTLDKLRAALGGPQTYPAIEDFIEELVKKRRSGASVSQRPIA